MKKIPLVALVLSSIFCQAVLATQADDTAIGVVRDDAGPTPFIRFVKLAVSNPSVLQTVKFAVTPRPGSTTRPLTATYPLTYLDARGYVTQANGDVIVPVFGLYAAFVNEVTLTYGFADGSSKSASVSLAAEPFSDPCGYGHPEIIQPRNTEADLGYDFILVKNACGTYSPTVLDIDGEIRWVGSSGYGTYTAIDFDNAFYVGPVALPQLLRNEFDGSVTSLADYAALGYTELHHTLERGKHGLLYQADGGAYSNSIFGEVDVQGQVLKTWNIATIISQVMTDGGDDPTLFVQPPPADWFHSNAMTYRASDDSLILSSRENFVIALDYESGAIKWILGDPTKQWAQFPSLRQFALDLSKGSVPPIGQHAISIDHDDHLMLFDNGTASFNHMPPGASRTYSAGRRYALDLSKGTATETWTYDANQTLLSAFCSSVYEDESLSLLVDYAYITNLGSSLLAELVGLLPNSEKVFEYRYPTTNCDQAFNSSPIHWENIVFPAVPQVIPAGKLANVSGRGVTRQGDGVMIGGFIINGTTPKRVLIRGLGPTLTAAGLANAIADPVLELHDSAQMIATNDDYVPSDDLTNNGLVPTSPKESVIVMSLNPGTYTAVLRDKNGAEGPALVEIYDLEPGSSRLGNLSTRATVEGGDNVLIGGFIVKNAPTKVLVRALGPSLQQQGVGGALPDPKITLYNSDGVMVMQNESWRSDQEAEIVSSELAPTDDREAAVISTLQIGNYTAIVSNQLETAATNGVGSVEIYYLTRP